MDNLVKVTNLLNRLIILAESGASRGFVRSAIENFEHMVMSFPQAEQPLEHFFTDGLYGRKILNPKGSVIVTKLHRESNFSFILQGILLCITEDGVSKLEAPKMFVTSPGTKRILVAVNDVIFCTVHPNPENLTDTDELESRIIAPSFSDIEIGGSL